MRDADTSSGAGRRAFLAGGVRWAAAGLLVAGTAWATRKNGSASCQKAAPCAACPVFLEGCDLPKAGAWRMEPRNHGVGL